MTWETTGSSEIDDVTAVFLMRSAIDSMLSGSRLIMRTVHPLRAAETSRDDPAA